MNFGIPFTPKKNDRIHELAYQFHDFSHFNIPDLVFDGSDSEFHRFVYISYRLMSEALTLVLADMIFVNGIFLNGGNYETYEGRKIYPIFKKMIEQNPDYINKFEEFVHSVLYASFKYCFFGDISFFEKLCGLSSGDDKDDILGNFRNKYDSYFTADMYWTANNYDNIVKFSSTYRDWFSVVKYWRRDEMDLQTIDEFADEFGLKHCRNNIELLDNIFESIYSKYIRKLIVTEIEPSNEQYALTNAFTRYMIGQSMLFFRYNSCKTIQQKFKLIDLEMRNHQKVTYQVVEKTRKYYNLCLDDLKDDGFITIDDVRVYQQVCPPFFVPNFLTGYEKFSSDGKTIEDFQKCILRL